MKLTNKLMNVQKQLMHILFYIILYILDNQQMSQYNDVIVYVVINFVQILFHI